MTHGHLDVMQTGDSDRTRSIQRRKRQTQRPRGEAVHASRPLCIEHTLHTGSPHGGKIRTFLSITILTDALPRARRASSLAYHFEGTKPLGFVDLPSAAARSSRVYRNPIALAQEWHGILASGECATRADLARSCFGGSSNRCRPGRPAIETDRNRAWLTLRPEKTRPGAGARPTRDHQVGSNWLMSVSALSELRRSNVGSLFADGGTDPLAEVRSSGSCFESSSCRHATDLSTPKNESPSENPMVESFD